MKLPDLSQLYSSFDIPNYDAWTESLGIENQKAASKYGQSISYKQRELNLGATVMLNQAAKSVNLEILSLLKNGVQSIHLAGNEEEIDYEVIFEGVFLNMIEVYGSDLPKAQAYLNSIGYAIQNLSESNTVLRLAKEELLTPTFPESNFQTILCTIDTNYIFQIARLRAIQHIIEEHGRAVRFIIVFDEKEEWDTDTTYIAHTVMSTITLHVGGDTVFPYFTSPNVSLEQNRVSTNIFHVLQMESKLDQVNDPLRGSYKIEELTGQMLQKMKQEHA